MYFWQYILPIHIFRSLAHSKVYFALNLRRRVHSCITSLSAASGCAAVMAHDILVLIQRKVMEWTRTFHQELNRYKDAKGGAFLLDTEDEDVVIKEAGTVFLNAIRPNDYKPDSPHKKRK